MTDRRRPLPSLPDGIWAHILQMLDQRSKVNCDRVNRQLHQLLSRPDLWDSIDLSFEQLVGSHNQQLHKPLQTPAARWVLARMTRPQQEQSSQTTLNLKGTAGCIAEGFTVPWFFSILEERGIAYHLNVELLDYPVEDHGEEDALQFRRLQLNDFAQRDIAALWTESDRILPMGRLEPM
ncbi:hypothetical protein WJX73_006779 [Symbiochloris irregularis]|uniref:F-box domain-containing protein n=1 Tax=Symbiochloris irregularis TaxID=706552 RepID=A0AAW1PXF4_9CHLO